MDFLKLGATGEVIITNYLTFGGNCHKTSEQKHNIQILQVRSKDLIVQREGIESPMYCQLPKNSKDGSETYWLTDDGNGFVRHYKSNFTDKRGLVENVTQTHYQFNA